MVYKTARQKFLIFLIIFTTFITFIAGYDSTWKMWFILPFTFGFLYIVGKPPYINKTLICV